MSEKYLNKLKDTLLLLLLFILIIIYCLSKCKCITSNEVLNQGCCSKAPSGYQARSCDVFLANKH